MLTDKIGSNHLPLLTSDSVEGFAQRFLCAIDGRGLKRYRQAMSQMNVVLEGLWDFALKPDLDELGFTEMPPPDKVWPRLWWVGSGLLSILPIHASGRDSDPSQTALDRVISYAPTVKSLAYAQERVARVDQVMLKDRVIVVAMPTTQEQKESFICGDGITKYLLQSVHVYKSRTESKKNGGTLGSISIYYCSFCMSRIFQSWQPVGTTRRPDRSDQAFFETDPGRIVKKDSPGL